MTVGRVGRPHGLDGSFVVERPSDAPERFSPGAALLAGGEPARVVASKRAGGRLVIRLDRGVERGAALQVLREDLPEPKPDAYYVFQLVGLVVEEEGGRQLGRIKDVVPGVANDVIELDTGLLLPLVEACVRAVDLTGARVVVAAGYSGDEG